MQNSEQKEEKIFESKYNIVLAFECGSCHKKIAVPDKKLIALAIQALYIHVHCPACNERNRLESEEKQNRIVKP